MEDEHFERWSSAVVCQLQTTVFFVRVLRSVYMVVAPPTNAIFFRTTSR